MVRGWLGAALKDGDLGDGPATGALVHEVDGSSPARRAGLRQGDVLVALDGAPVTSAAEVRNRIALARPGSSLQVRFLRDGVTQQDVERAARLAHLHEDVEAFPEGYDRRDAQAPGEDGGVRGAAALVRRESEHLVPAEPGRH